MTQKKDPETSPDQMESVMDEEGIDSGLAGKYNDDITGEAVLTEKIDLNDSRKEDLMRIPGIREDTAEKIKQYTKNKKIESFEDLKGILDEKTIDILRMWFKIE